MSTATEDSSWPTHLRPGAVRFAHASDNYDATIAFYRDLVGLPVIGEFTNSFGEDGTIFGFPDTTVQLEVVRGHADAGPATGSFDQLVLYLHDAAAVTVATEPLRAAGLARKPDEHPYWAANGAVTYQDPDGRDIVFAPWVYGRDPEPVDVGSHT
jgi:catechol 2,3-dioxygenase-like lactoylglutathione lyase family enzyme